MKKMSKKWFTITIDKNIEFLSRGDSAPNVPQARPIEKYWSFYKWKFSEYNKPVNSVKKITKI